jgi:predicted secreted hydrolase
MNLRFSIGVIGVSALLAGVACVNKEAHDRGSVGETTESIARALGDGDTGGFARAYAPREFVFPRDHGPHPRYKHEWWYVTGNVQTANERHFGFQLTFFRIGLTPVVITRPSAWATKGIYMAHFTLSDVASRQFYAFERFSRAAVGLAGASSTPLRVWLEDWSLQGNEAGGAAGKLSMRLHAAERGVAIDLVVDSNKPIVLQGEHGLSRKSATPGNASYYYSATRLRTHGVVRIGDESFGVDGLSWLDREWGTSALDKEQVGWDWFALQLSDGRELMYYQLRRRDGTVHPFSQGMLVSVDGAIQRLAAEDVQLDVEDRWQSPGTGVQYPSRWRLRVQQAQLDLTIEPYLPNQELNVSVRYWEGAVRAHGSAHGHAVSANGYVELVGYGPGQQGQLRPVVAR